MLSFFVFVRSSRQTGIRRSVVGKRGCGAHPAKRGFRHRQPGVVRLPGAAYTAQDLVRQAVQRAPAGRSGGRAQRVRLDARRLRQGLHTSGKTTRPFVNRRWILVRGRRRSGKYLKWGRKITTFSTKTRWVRRKRISLAQNIYTYRNT